MNQNLPVFYLVTVLLASFVGIALQLNPEDSFVSKHHILNQWFVKMGWFWTLMITLPLIWFTNIPYLKYKALGMLAMSSIYFYFAGHVIDLVFIHTGSCLNQTHQFDPASCKKYGGKWDGFDISGHCFLLIHSSLTILELLNTIKIREKYLKIVARVFLLTWFFMLIVTCIYYHSITESIFGYAFGVGFWAFVYSHGRFLLN